jgi:hypothetical protein
MNQPDDDWTQLFGTIHVGASSEPAKPAPPPNKPASSVKIPPATNQLQPGETKEVSPGVFEMAASFGTSMAKFAASGFKTTHEAMQKNRTQATIAMRFMRLLLASQSQNAA